MFDIAKKIFGTKNDREIKNYRVIVNKINSLESEFEKHKVYMLGTRRFLFSIEKDRTVSTTSQASDVG